VFDDPRLLDETPPKETRMDPVRVPHRVTVLTPLTALAPADAEFAPSCWDLVEHVVFRALVRHPAVSMTDPYDRDKSDGGGRTWNAQHPELDSLLNWEFGAARRDEVLWFEIDVTGTPRVTLKVVRGGDRGVDQFPAFGAGALSQLVTTCLNQWLDARRLGPLPRPVDAFSVEDLLRSARQLDQFFRVAETDAGQVPQLLQQVTALRVPFLHIACEKLKQLGFSGDLAVLAIDPEDVDSLRNEYLRKLDDGSGKRADILPIIAAAPAWGKPHLSVHGEGFGEDVSTYHQSLAAALMPTNPWALDNYAIGLIKLNRYDEAHRQADRATRHSPHFARAHFTALRALRSTDRAGETLGEAHDRHHYLHGEDQAGRMSPLEWPALTNTGLLFSEAMNDVGRLDEAIQLLHTNLNLYVKDAQDEFKWHVKEVKRWETDPEALALAYAREGYYRRDPGRVLAGYARAKVPWSSDVRALIESLLDLGKDELAPFAYAHYRGANLVGRPCAQLAGARALLVAGQLNGALKELARVELRFPQSHLESEVNRLLRLAACRPAAEWDAVIADRLATGANRIARRHARQAADFVPGLETSEAVQAALGPRTEVAFDPRWLDPLRAAIAPADTRELDAYFAAPAQEEPTLACADRLAATWGNVLAPAQPGDPTHAAQALYVFVQAFCRYLALTTRAPNPLAGGLRQVATEALKLTSRTRQHGTPGWSRGALETLELAIDACASDEDFLDGWLLRVERALDLEHRFGGHLHAMCGDLPRVSALLRGDEQIAAELRRAQDLREDPATHADARELYWRVQRAIGTGRPAVAWSDLADGTLPPEHALDAHWTATHCAPTYASPWLNLTRALIARGLNAHALETLIRGFQHASGHYFEKQREAFAPLYERAGFDVPYAWNEAQTRGMTLLQSGDFAGAVRHLRWCDALDANNKVLARNLGIAWARLGEIAPALECFAEADVREAPKWTGQALSEAGHLPQAVLAYRYASIYFTTAEEWLTLAIVAYHAEDDEAAADAFGRAWALSGGAALDGASLNCYAAVLDNLGDYDGCARVAAQLAEIAGGDAVLASCAHHHRACALLGLGRSDEGTRAAEDALRAGPHPDNVALFQETLDRCRRNDPRPAHPPRSAQPIARAWAAIESGDFHGAAQLAAGESSWTAARAGLTAARFRHESESDRWVAEASVAVANSILEQSAGELDVDAAIARVDALRVREDAWLPSDVPARLGARLSARDFDSRFAERGTGSNTTAST
jgi:tetratricopeptide (TPR) repeat protein